MKGSPWTAHTLHLVRFHFDGRGSKFRVIADIAVRRQSVIRILRRLFWTHEHPRPEEMTGRQIQTAD
jgi:hypothetical protein